MENQMKIFDPSTMIPSYAQGLPVLLVDHDISSLTSLASMLEKFSYKVTTVEQARPAISMIEERQKAFKLVIANVKMPDMDIHAFLKALLEKDIPLILITLEMKSTTAAKLLEEGASFVLKKPITMNDVKYLWQHAFQTKDDETLENNHNQNENISKIINNNCDEEDGLSGPGSDSVENRRMEISKGKRAIGIAEDDDETDGKNVKRAKCTESNVTVSENIEKDEEKERENVSASENIEKDEEKEKERENGNATKSRGKRHSIWTPELHLKFTAAISALGDKHARPKSILQMMNVPCLTQRQVASHLQKYKAQVQRISDMTASNDWKSSKEPYDYPSNYNYPFGAAKLAENLFNANNSSSDPKEWTKGGFEYVPNSENQNKNSPAATGATSADGKVEFSLGGKINLSNLPLFSNMNPNNGLETLTCDASFIPPANSDLMNSVPYDSSYNIFDSVPSATSYVMESDFDMMGFIAPEPDLNQIGLVQPAPTYYVPPGSLVPSAESDNYMASEAIFNHTDSIPSSGSYVLETSLDPPFGIENPNLNSGEFGDFMDLFGMDSTNYVGGEPAPGEADRFFNWLSDALNGDEDNA